MVSRSASRVIAILAILLFITFFAISIRDWPDSTMMADTGVIHLVHFQFKAGTTESEKKEVCYIFAQIRGRDLRRRAGADVACARRTGRTRDACPEGPVPQPGHRQALYQIVLRWQGQLARGYEREFLS